MDSRQTFWTICLPCFLVILAIGSTLAQCPATVLKCNCTFDGNLLNTIVCTGLNQESIPLFTPTNQSIPTLEIKDSVLYKLQGNAFQGLKIRNLLINNADIQVVEDGALKGLAGFLESFELRGNKFTILPDGFLRNFTQLNTLSLEGNELAYVKTSWFTNLKSLQYLSFSNNGISAIQMGSFDSSPNLEKLYLSGNKLHYLEEDIFLSLKSLKELGLADNYLTTLPQALLRRLTKLTWLDLTSNRLENIPEGFFESSQSLSQLFLGSNNLSEIKTSHLPSSNTLSTLTLSNNNISRLWDTSFQNVRNLKSLSLDHNYISSIPELGFEYLEHLEILNLQENVISELPVNNLVGLLALKRLNLAGNNIKVLTYGIFDPLGLLNYLDLSRNRLAEIQFGPFDALRKLVYLDLRRNALKAVEDHWFRQAESLKTLHMDHNMIRTIEPTSFQKMTKLNTLSLNYNYLQTLPGKLFYSNSNLTSLSISHNPLNEIPMGTFANLNKLITLRLNYTCLSTVPSGLFKNLTILEELNLDHTPLETIDSYSFSGLSNLKVLQLGHHNITSIAPRSFATFSNLREITLENMELVTDDLIDILYDLPKVRKVNLGYNLVEYVDKSTFESNTVIESLNLIGNPLKCDCRLGWLRVNPATLEDPERTMCTYPSGDSNDLVLCFPLPPQCAMASNPSLGQICSGARNGATVDSNRTSFREVSLNFDHCIVPPEPTSPRPTTISTTVITTISPIVIHVQLIENDTVIVVNWDKHDNPVVTGYRVRYRQFATNITRKSVPLGLNESSYTIADFSTGMNVIVCIELRTATGYVTHEQSCEEIGRHLGRTTGSPGDPVTAVVLKDDLPWIPIVGASAAALVVIFIIILGIVLSLRNVKTRFSENAKKKEDRDKMVKDKMGMWVNSFNYDGNVHESMGEQLTLEFDIFSGSKQDINSKEPGVVAPARKNGIKSVGYEEDVPNPSLNGDVNVDMSSDPGYVEPSESDAGYGEVTESEIAYDDVLQYDNSQPESQFHETQETSRSEIPHEDVQQNEYNLPANHFQENQDSLNETYMY